MLAESNEAFLEVLWPSLPNLPDVEINKAHGEHVVGEKGELVFPVLVVRLKGIPKEGDVFLFLRAFARERQIFTQFGCFFPGLRLCRGGFVLAPNTC